MRMVVGRDEGNLFILMEVSIEESGVMLMSCMVGGNILLLLGSLLKEDGIMGD